MKTISTNRSLNENFKRVQLLPALDPEIMARLRASGSWSVVQPAAPGPVNTAGAIKNEDSRWKMVDGVCHPEFLRHLQSSILHPRVNSPVVLGLIALVGLGQVPAAMTSWPTNWIALFAWVSRFAG